VVVGEFASFSTEWTALSGSAAAGIGAGADGVNFTFVVAEPGLNDAGLVWIGALAAVLEKQPFEIHSFDIACGEIGQQPIKVAASVPMSNVLTQLPRKGQKRARVFCRAMFEIAATDVNDQ